MEGNGYLMNLRNWRRYTPYEFDIKMSKNEDRMNRLGKIIDQDIYFSLMSQKKKIPNSEENYVVENDKEFNPLNQNLIQNNFNYQSAINPKNNLMQISNNSFKIPRSPNYQPETPSRFLINNEKRILDDNKIFNTFGNERNINNRPEEQINPYQKKNEEFNEYNMERKLSRRVINNEFNPKTRNKINYNDWENDNRNINNRYNDYEDQKEIYNNNFRSQNIPRRNNYNAPRSPINYESKEDNYKNNRYNNSFRDKMNDIDLNNIQMNKEKNYLNTKNLGDTLNNRRRFYNSQLNFPPKEDEF